MTNLHLFKWRHFQSDMILCCVRWYLRFALSYRDLEEMMAERGLSVEISFQADQADQADLLASRPAHARNLAAAKLVKEANLPLTVNVVLHRVNIERVEQIIALAEQLDAQRLELANTQYLGWAFLN